MRRAVETAALQEDAAPGFDEFGVGGADAGVRQGVQGQGLANEQVAPALVGGAVAGRGELHQHRVPIAQRAELGLLAAGAGAGQGLPQRLGGEGRVQGGGRVHHGRAGALRRGQAQEAVERGAAYDEVAGQVFAGVDQRFQDVVVAPVLQVGGQLQGRVRSGEAPTEKALRPHVVEEPGQAVVKGAAAVRLVGFVHPEAAAVQRVERAERAQRALWCDFMDGHLAADAVHLARQQVAPRPRRTHRDHPAAGHERGQQARQRGLADAQALLQLGGARLAAQAAQGLQQLGFAGGCGAHEWFFEWILERQSD